MNEVGLENTIKRTENQKVLNLTHNSRLLSLNGLDSIQDTLEHLEIYYCNNITDMSVFSTTVFKNLHVIQIEGNSCTQVDLQKQTALKNVQISFSQL